MLKHERHMDMLQQKQAGVLFNIRTWMISVRNDFKNNYEDLMCPRCKKDLHWEALFTKCKKLAYNINDPNEVLKEGLSKERMIKKCSLSNSNYIMFAKKCWCESGTISFTLAKMEFMSAIIKKLYFSKYSIKRCCKKITSIQNFVWSYK